MFRFKWFQMVSNAFRKTNVLQVLLYPSTTGTHLLPRLVHGAHRSSALCREHWCAGATQCSSFLIKVWRSFTNKLFISCCIILYLFLVSLIFPTGQLQIHSANQSDLQLLVPYWILLVYAIQLWIVIDISTLNEVVRLVVKELTYLEGPFLQGYWSIVLSGRRTTLYTLGIIMEQNTLLQEDQALHEWIHINILIRINLNIYIYIYV